MISRRKKLLIISSGVCLFVVLYLNSWYGSKNGSYEFTDNISARILQNKLNVKENKPATRTGNNYLSSCLNKVRFEHTRSVWTMLTDDANYAHSAIKLLNSLRLNTDRGFDANVLELASKPLQEPVRSLLLDAGWRLCRVHRIPPREEPNTFWRFRDQFAKLVLWNMTEYAAVVYLDSDTLVVDAVDPLLDFAGNLTRARKRLGVTRDIRAGRWKRAFNMGVFVVRPDAAEFRRLVRLKDDPRCEFETTMAEQGFLNVVYKSQWLEIGFEFNANLAAYVQKPAYWRRRERNIRVIHYTMVKPWRCNNTEYSRVCQLWERF